MNLVSVFLSCTACLPLIHMSKNILWVGALQGIQFWGCRQGMLLLWSNIFCMCARPTCSSSTVGPNDIPGAAAQPLPPHSVYVPHRESWASYLKFLPEKKKNHLGESYLETFCNPFYALFTPKWKHKSSMNSLKPRL